MYLQSDWLFEVKVDQPFSIVVGMRECALVGCKSLLILGKSHGDHVTSQHHHMTGPVNYMTPTFSNAISYL